MADKQRVVSVKLRFEFDKSSFANVRENTRALQEELAKLDRQRALSQAARDAADFAAQGGSARAAVARLNAELTKLDATADEVRQVAREFDALRESAQRAAQATKEVGRAGGRGSALSRAGQELRALPSVPLGGGLTSDAFGKLISILGGLSPVVLGAVAAIGGLIVGLQRLAAEGGQAIQSLINTQGEYYRALKTGTRESLQAAIETKRVEIDILRARVQEYQNLFAQFEREAGVIGRAFADALNIGNMQTLRTELEGLEAKLRDEEFALGRLTQALNDVGVAARTAEEASRALAERVQRDFDAMIDAALQARLSAAEMASVEELDKRVASLTRERDALQQEIALGGISEELSERYRRRVIEVNAAIDALTNSTLRQEIEARERERDAIERAKRAREELINRQLAVAKAQVDAARAGDAYRASLEKIATDARAKLAAAASEREKALVQAEREALKARADALKARDNALNEAARKAQESREALERDHQKRLADIQRRGMLDYQQALEDRDAVAAARAQQAAAENVREEKERYAERRAEIDRALQEQTAQINARYQEQTAQINARLAEQRAAIDARYAEQVQSIKAAAARAREAEQQAYQQRLAALVQQLQEQNRLSAQGAAAALGIQRQYWQGTLALVQQAAASVEALRARAAAMTPASGVRLVGPTRAVPALLGGARGMRAFDTGGYVTRTGAAVVHAGEYIMNPARGQYPINFAPIVNVSGGGADQIKQILHAEVERFAARLQQEAF